MGALMADTDAILSAIESRGSATSSQIGERMAIVETKIGGLEESSKVIRSTLHGINGELQKTALHEERCAAALRQIADQTKGLPELLQKIHAFDEITPKVRELIEESTRRKGAWRVWGMIAGAVGLLGTFASAIAALVLHYVAP